MNKRLRQFNILKAIFCHEIEKHQQIVGCVVVLTQLSIDRGETLFKIDESEYCDSPQGSVNI